MNATKRELSDYVPLDSNFSEAYKKASQAIYTEFSKDKHSGAPRGNSSIIMYHSTLVLMEVDLIIQ